MKRFVFLFALVVAVLFAACDSQKRVLYFQDLPPGASDTIQDTLLIRLQVSDNVNIHVAARDPEISDLFNSGGGKSSGAGSSGYTIDSNGDINYPVLGKLHVVGMTREELTEYITRLLAERQLVRDPVVTVEFGNLSVLVLGDAASSTRLHINKDYYTLLDAMTDMGDLQLLGVRETVKVLRNNNGIVTAYNVNLTSAKDIYSSPVYYLQQNDVIYVAPNPKHTRNYYQNASLLVTPSFWTSVVSTGFSFATMIIALTKK